jgi:hypothetical protein
MFYVIRTHSHTDKQQLWKVMSRGIKEKQQCDDWKDFCEQQYLEENPNGHHKFFVVEKQE